MTNREKNSRFTARVLGVALGLMALVAAGCGDPCVDLSHKICRCEPNDIEQRACMQRVDNDAATRKTNEKQRNECNQLIDTCSCSKLAEGDLAACGLAQPEP